jgi:hypothetical protein
MGSLGGLLIMKSEKFRVLFGKLVVILTIPIEERNYNGLQKELAVNIKKSCQSPPGSNKGMK